MQQIAGYTLIVVLIILIGRFVLRDTPRPWDRGPRDADDPPEWP